MSTFKAFRNSKVVQGVLAWLRQSTTVHGLAVLAMTAIGQSTGGAPTWVVLGGAASGLVLLVFPGQGNTAAVVNKAVVDLGAVIAAKGSSQAVSALAADGVALDATLKK